MNSLFLSVVITIHLLSFQTTGDAISDLLLVETILHARGWSIADWNSSYTELPNRQVKVKVRSNHFSTNNKFQVNEQTQYLF